ncbi:MAG: DSD1 family PLP-dependent enzyme [Betaproteobacteria bacterium]
MTWPAPARIGMAIDEIDTPALLIDLDAFEFNLRTLTDSLHDSGARLRPHAKTHKCPEIALRQIALGAVGVCCQKVSEAEALVAGGISDVLVTNEIVGDVKLARLAELARAARIGVCVDHPEQVEQLGRAAATAGARIDVYVELDVGQGRCGVSDPAVVVALAGQVQAHPQLRFEGLQAYHGRAQHLREPAERERAVGEARRIVAACVAALTEAGVAVNRVTGAGTGTYLLEAGSGVWNELQPGSYIFMDADYSRNRIDATAPRFRQSLYVLSTVISLAGGRVILDAGLKAYAVDSGLPQVPEAPGWQFAKATDEHGVLIPASSAPPLPLAMGTKLRLVPGHCDPTVNLHDWFVGTRAGVVETLWQISARGAIF